MLSIRQRINEFRSSTFFITAVVCYAIFVDQLFFAFVLPVLPFSLPERNGIREDRVQYWTVILIVVFGVATLLSCPIVGWWIDRHTSRRLPFLAGLGVLLGSTLLMWLAKPMWAQVLSRVGQGVADAMIYIVGYTIIIDTVTTKRVAEYVGHITIALNVGTFAGPLLGGVVFNRAGYDAVWAMMVGFVVLDALLRLVMKEKGSRIQGDTKLQRSETGSDQELSPFDAESSKEHQISKPSLAAQRLGTVQDITHLSPTEDLAVQRARWKSLKQRLPTFITLLFSMRMNVALLGVCVQSMVFSGFETVLALYVQEIWHYNSLGAGLIFIPLTIPAFIAPLIGRAIDRTTPRWALVAGFLGLCPVLVAARFVTSDSMSQKVLMCALLVLIGLGITLTLSPLSAEISYVVEELEKKEPERYSQNGRSAGGSYAQAYALFAMAWSVGNIAGPLFCGLIKDEADWGTMCWALGLISGVTALPCLIWSGGNIWASRAPK